MSSTKFNDILEKIKTVSVITAIGSGLGLYSLNFREQYASWLIAEYVPFIGIPLLIFFYLSLPFGAMGALKIILDEWNGLRGMLKDLREIREKKGNGTEQ